MGIPIKSRGIKWQENYSEKSAYLKKEMDAQIGQGAYLRWTGHDVTSNTDYYVVVSPGFSKKFGYHFFAGLRKMPAKQGASGKKFKTQMEALQYAYAHWMVPPPNDKPAKPYTINDIMNKEIVLENTHGKKPSVIDSSTVPQISASVNSKMFIISSLNNFIEKTAMSLHGTGRYGNWERCVGRKDLNTNAEWAAHANLAVGIGAAWNTRLRLIGTDGLNQDPDMLNCVNTLTGGNTGKIPITAHMSDPQSPDQKSFNSDVFENGQQEQNQLFEKKLLKGKNAVFLKPPTFKSPFETYEHITFNDVKNVKAKVIVGETNLQNFEQLKAKYEQTGSTLGGSFFAVNDKKPKPGSRQNHEFTVNIPLDLYEGFTNDMQLGKVGMVRVPDFAHANAAKIYTAAKNNNLYAKDASGTKPIDLNTLITTNPPVFEEFSLKGHNLMRYDERGIPLGIGINRSRSLGQEAKHESVSYQFSQDKVPELLKMVNGDASKIRGLFASGQVKLTPDMFKDSRTCAPLINQVITKTPLTDSDMIPELDQNGQVREAYMRNVPASHSVATKINHQGQEMHVVRVWDSSLNAFKLVPMPEGIEPVQQFDGSRTITEATKLHVQGPDGNWHSIEGREWEHYDTKSKGKFVQGKTEILNLSPLLVSSHGVDRTQKANQTVQGVWLGHANYFAHREYKQGIPHPKDPTVVEKVTDNTGKIIGYYRVISREERPDPITKINPNSEVQMYKTINGEVLPDEPMKITPEMAIKGQDAHGLTFFNSADALKYMKGIFALSDQDIGPFTPLNVQNLNTINDRGADAQSKVEKIKKGELTEEQLSPEEKLFYEIYKDFDKSGDLNLAPVFKSVENAPYDPTAFKARKGNFYTIQDLTIGEEVGETNGTNLYSTELAANTMKDALLKKARAGHDLQVVIKHQDVPLVGDPNNPTDENVTLNVPYKYEPELPNEGVEQEPEVLQPIEEPIQEESEVLQPIEDEIGTSEPYVPEMAEVGQSQEPMQSQTQSYSTPDDFGVQDAGSNIPVQQEQIPQQNMTPQVPVASELGNVSQQPPQIKKPFRPAVLPQPAILRGNPSVKANEIVNKLIILANKLDDEGKTEAAQRVDIVIKETIKKLNN